MGVDDSSPAVLLKKGDLTVAHSAAAASVSLATLTPGVERPSDKDTVVSVQTPSRSPSDWDNVYDFLKDGTRAVKVLCRPFPTAIVGIPVDTQFDVAKATLKLQVRVSPEDEPCSERLGLASPDSESPDEAELPTEVYVP